MAGQHADVAVERLGDHHLGRPGPDLAVRHDQLHPQGHELFSRSLAFFSTSSMPPTMKNACSGRLSYLPSVMALNEEMVSLQRHEHAVLAGELLGHEHRVGQEPLDPAGPLDGDLVLLGQLVDAEDGDDVLQLGVALQDPLHLARDVVVLLADVARVQDPGGRGQRVHRREDALLGDLAGQHRGGVEVGERGGRRRVGDVVGGHVDRLHRGDRVTAGRGDPLLELAHLVGQRRLVAHRRRHPAEQRRDLGAGLGEPEDVVDEQQHVLALHVAEVLRHRQGGQRDPQPGARRLVHLAEDQRGVGDDPGLGHLRDQVVALAGPLADARRSRTRRRSSWPPG